MTTDDAADATLLEVMVVAALGGHDLGSWEALLNDGGAPRGWQALCRRCGRTVWVGPTGLQYSLLADACPGMSGDDEGAEDSGDWDLG